MKTFAALYRRLDAATSTKHKSLALQDYLRAAIADKRLHASAAWTVYFLAGGKPRQMISTKLLRQLALDRTQLPEWLFEECYQNVGDLAETLALLLPIPETIEEAPLDVWMTDRLLSLRSLDDFERFERLSQWTNALPHEERLPFFKLITGALRIGISKLQVIKALADATGVDARRMAQRMMGYTQAGRTLQGRGFQLPSSKPATTSRAARAAIPIRSFSRIRFRRRSRTCRRCWGRSRTGWWNGNSTASVRNTSIAPGNGGRGLAARNWSARAFPSSPLCRTAFPTARSSTANWLSSSRRSAGIRTARRLRAMRCMTSGPLHYCSRGLAGRL